MSEDYRIKKLLVAEEDVILGDSAGIESIFGGGKLVLTSKRLFKFLYFDC